MTDSIPMPACSLLVGINFSSVLDTQLSCWVWWSGQSEITTFQAIYGQYTLGSISPFLSTRRAWGILFLLSTRGDLQQLQDTRNTGEDPIAATTVMISNLPLSTTLNTTTACLEKAGKIDPNSERTCRSRDRTGNHPNGRPLLNRVTQMGRPTGQAREWVLSFRHYMNNKGELWRTWLRV